MHYRDLPIIAGIYAFLGVVMTVSAYFAQHGGPTLKWLGFGMFFMSGAFLTMVVGAYMWSCIRDHLRMR